jgi:hypothetical protein
LPEINALAYLTKRLTTLNTLVQDCHLIDDGAGGGVDEDAAHTEPEM